MNTQLTINTSSNAASPTAGGQSGQHAHHGRAKKGHKTKGGKTKGAHVEGNSVMPDISASTGADSPGSQSTPWERMNLENQQEAWSSEDENGVDDTETNGEDPNAVIKIDREAAKAVDDVTMQVIRNLKKKLFYANNRAVYYGKVLHRRTEVIEEIRSSYLRDVITMKLIVNNILKDTEREAVMQHYNACIPCIDLRQSLPIHAPESAHMMLRPCEHCGGQLEFLISDSARLVAMRKERDHYKASEEQLKITTASLEYKLESRKQDLYVADMNFTNEKAVLYSEIRKFREENERLHTEMQGLKAANTRLRETKLDEIADIASNNVDVLHEQLALAQKDHNTLTHSISVLREQVHHNQLEMMEMKNAETKLNDTIKVYSIVSTVRYYR
jgi:hypothetical protein